MKKIAMLTMAAALLAPTAPTFAAGVEAAPAQTVAQPAAQTEADLKLWQDWVSDSVGALPPGEKREAWLKENGFQKVGTSQPKTRSIGIEHHAAVSFSFDYYKNSYNGVYTAIGNWSFAAGQIDTSAGSREVLSLSLWTTSYGKPSGIVWSSYPTRLYVYDSLGGMKENTSTHRSTLSNGFIWDYQDAYVYDGSGYKGQKGTAIMYANSMPSSTMYLGMNYEHTWANLGSISSATLGYSTTNGIDLSVTWSGSGSSKREFKNQTTIYSWPSRYVQ